MNILEFASKLRRYIRRNGRYWSARKLANAALASLALRGHWRHNPAMPMVIKLEATNICNGSCKLCPVALKRPSGRGAGMMDFELFTSLIDQLKKTAVVADLTNWGESLLHKRIIDMVRYAHEARLYTYLSTNLHTVREHHIDELMSCGLDELTLSLHGLDEQSYQGYQPGFSFAQCDELIARLTEARQRLSRDGKPKMTLNFVVTAINAHQVDQLAEYANKYGVDYALSGVSLNLRFEISREMARNDPDAAREIIARYSEWLPEDKRYDRPIYRKLAENPALMYSPVKRFACDWPWRKLVVNFDGALSACCGSYHASDDLGQYNIGDSIAKLWNSPRYKAARASFKRPRQQLHEDCDCGAADQLGETGDTVICDHCPGILL